MKEERPSVIKERREGRRTTDGEKKKGEAAAMQRPFASAAAQPVTAQPETHHTPLNSLSPSLVSHG